MPAPLPDTSLGEKLLSLLFPSLGSPLSPLCCCPASSQKHKGTCRGLDGFISGQISAFIQHQNAEQGSRIAEAKLF